MSIFPLLRQQSLDYEKISTIETRYFIDHFLVSEAITMIYGRASQGKTFFLLGLVKMLSKREDVSEIVYVDLDNPKSQLKKRNLHVHFKDNKKITYIHKGDMIMDKHELLELFRSGAKEKGEPYKDCIFIIDSTRDFFHNLYNDIEVRQFMQTMKDVRDAGGTVLLIHHSTKSGKVIDGSADFTKSSDNVYELKQKAKIGEVLHYTLRIEYDRDDIKHCGFSVNTQTLELEELDPDLSQMSEYEEEFVNEVKKVLEKNPKGLNKSQILEMLGYERTDVTARATLEKFIDKYWQSTKIKNQFNITLIS